MCVCLRCTGGKPLHISKGLLAKLQSIYGGDAPAETFTKEEEELAQRLHDDFARFPAAEDIAASEPEFVSRSALQQPTGMLHDFE